MFNFIKDNKTKTILKRDYAYAEICKEQEMFKPAIILYGSIMEEVLRTILLSKKEFLELIILAKEKRIIENHLATKIDFIRDFRNYVHIFLEKKKHFEPTGNIANVASEVCAVLIKIANKNS